MKKRYLLIPSYETCPHPALANAAMEAGYSVISTSTAQNVFNQKNLEIFQPAHQSELPISRWRQGEQQAADLSEIIRANPVTLAAAGTDWHLSLLYDAQKLSPNFTICGPPQLTFNTLSSKISSRDFFSSSDIAIPRGLVVRAPDYEIDALQGLPFPLVVKLDPSVGSSGVSIAHDLDQMQLSIAKAKLFGADLVVEEFLGTTDEYSHQFFVDENEWFPAYSLRKHSHLGPSFSTCIEIIGRSTEKKFFFEFSKFFSKLPKGFYSAQFKEDRRGALKLIEINCRIGNNFRILRRALPALGQSFLDFYSNSKSWESQYEKLRSQVVERYAVSPVEELLAAWQRVSFGSDKWAIRAFFGEARHLTRILKTNPIVDYYFCSLLSDPRVSMSYYRQVFSEARALKDRRRRQSLMLPR